MAISRKAYEQGIDVEKEHLPTYKWLESYLKKNNGKLPDKVEFYLHIAHDHLNEFPDYYDALDKMEKELKKKSK